MACPGGCITGGGQPILNAGTSERINIKAERAKAIYTEDEAQTVRKSHNNPFIKALYEEFLGSLTVTWPMSRCILIIGCVPKYKHGLHI